MKRLKFADVQIALVLSQIEETENPECYSILMAYLASGARNHRYQQLLFQTAA